MKANSRKRGGRAEANEIGGTIWAHRGSPSPALLYIGNTSGHTKVLFFFSFFFSLCCCCGSLTMSVVTSPSIIHTRKGKCTYSVLFRHRVGRPAFYSLGRLRKVRHAETARPRRIYVHPAALVCRANHATFSFVFFHRALPYFLVGARQWPHATACSLVLFDKGRFPQHLSHVRGTIPTRALARSRRLQKEEEEVCVWGGLAGRISKEHVRDR